jgi:hypothetical protein
VTAILRWLSDLADPSPRVSMSCVRAAVLREQMDRHPAEDMEPHYPVGVSVRPGDVRKRPVFELRKGAFQQPREATPNMPPGTL